MVRCILILASNRATKDALLWKDGQVGKHKSAEWIGRSLTIIEAGKDTDLIHFY